MDILVHWNWKWFSCSVLIVIVYFIDEIWERSLKKKRTFQTENSHLYVCRAKWNHNNEKEIDSGDVNFVVPPDIFLSPTFM